MSLGVKYNLMLARDGTQNLIKYSRNINYIKVNKTLLGFIEKYSLIKT